MLQVNDFCPKLITYTALTVTSADLEGLGGQGSGPSPGNFTFLNFIWLNYRKNASDRPLIHPSNPQHSLERKLWIHARVTGY